MISVTILTKNSQRYLLEVLQSVQGFAEVLVFDNGSTDDTLLIASQFPNVRIVEGRFVGFGATHNIASAAAKYDWIFSLDSDEVVTKDLQNELGQLKLQKGCVYSLPRQNYYNGKWIRWCGWHPDRQLRIYNKLETRFTNAEVHEAVIAEGMQVISLKGAIRHYSYRNTAEFLSKMQVYSDLFAKQYQGRRSSSLTKALSHAFAAFFKSYIVKRGLMGGFEGFVISVYQANTAFYKYLKLMEANAALAKVEKGADGQTTRPFSAE